MQETTMPYIPQKRRDEISAELVGDTDKDNGLDWAPQNAGDLNYLVTCFVDNYLLEHGVRYANINEMIGALECCKLELYRKIAVPYEDFKAFENGGVYQSKIEGELY
jgi:hypothetical protein